MVYPDDALILRATSSSTPTATIDIDVKIGDRTGAWSIRTKSPHLYAMSFVTVETYQPGGTSSIYAKTNTITLEGFAGTKQLRINLRETGDQAAVINGVARIIATQPWTVQAGDTVWFQANTTYPEHNAKITLDGHEVTWNIY